MMAEMYTPEAGEQIRQRRAGFGALKSEGTAWDIASAVVFLASDDARWITAQVFNVDAGWADLIDRTYLSQSEGKLQDMVKSYAQKS
jgi:NAD(P)-dependent dehydrogenase (short-subunit alcohol dehydrogenase family)